MCPARTAAWRTVHKGAASGEKVALPPAVRGRPMRGAPAVSPSLRPAPAATAAGVATARAATGAPHGGGDSVRKRETAPPLSRPAQWMGRRTSRAGWRPSKTRRPLPPRPRRRVKKGRRGEAQHRAAPPAATNARGPHLQDASQPRLGNEDGFKAQIGRWPLPPTPAGATSAAALATIRSGTSRRNSSCSRRSTAGGSARRVATRRGQQKWGGVLCSAPPLRPPLRPSPGYCQGRCCCGRHPHPCRHLLFPSNSPLSVERPTSRGHDAGTPSPPVPPLSRPVAAARTRTADRT